MLARPYIEFVHPDDVERTRDEISGLQVGQLCVRFMNRYRDVRGEYRWFEWTAKPVLEEGIVFAVARDVTERVILEDLLRAYEGRG
jgi:PAS domain S-box-containing protein